MKKVGVTKMRTLKQMCEHTIEDKIQNDCIRGDIQATLTEEKMTENWLR